MAERGTSATETGCEHGTALDVHCCNCHSGFMFDADHECPDQSTCNHAIFVGNDQRGYHCPQCNAKVDQFGNAIQPTASERIQERQ